MLNLSLAIISGILTGLSFDFPCLSFLAWFSLAPLLYVISRSKTRPGLLASFLFGLAFYGTTIFWIGKVSRLGLVFLLIYLSFYPLLFFIGGRHFLRRPLRILTLPALWVILELLKEHLFSGFGWANLGYAQFRNLNFIQVADLGGVKLISFLIVMVNTLIYEIFFISANFRQNLLTLKKEIIFVGLIMSSCFAYSYFQRQGLREDNFLSIDVIEPNIPQELKWQEPMRPYIVRELYSLAKDTEDVLVVFPESAWPFILNDNFEDLQEFVRKTKRNTLMGTIVEDEGKYYNAALLLDRDGRLLKKYYKVKLVPFGEYVPLRKYLKFIPVINYIGDMSRGEDYKVFSYEGRNFSVLICFEDIFPSFVSRLSRKADFLINITNDAWFGGEPEATQHLSIMAMRAIENRISIVRSANTGISGWVSFRGEIKKLASKKRGASLGRIESFKVALNKNRSFYNKYGDFFLLLCALFLLGISIKKVAGRE